MFLQSPRPLYQGGAVVASDSDDNNNGGGGHRSSSRAGGHRDKERDKDKERERRRRKKKEAERARCVALRVVDALPVVLCQPWWLTMPCVYVCVFGLPWALLLVDTHHQPP